MKTLTELSGTLIRTAAAAIADARRTLPKDEKPAATPTPEASQAPAPDASAAPIAEAAASESTPAPAVEAPKAREGKQAQEPESDAVKAALDAAVAEATGVSGDRLAMLRAAVEAAGKRAEDVRLVRVFGPEEQVAGASAIGGHQYLVDYFPASMKQVAGASRDDRGKRGGGRGGRGGGGGGGSRGAKAGATGGFSMDSLREDRRNERGGRGRPLGSRRPGGEPKK